MKLHTFQLANYRLAFDTASGVLVYLTRGDSSNALGHGQMPTSAIEVTLGWQPTGAMPAYAGHKQTDDTLALTVTLDSLQLTDTYQATGGLLERRITVTNTSAQEVQLTGLRLALGGVALGDPGDCRFEAPGNVIRPRLPLARAASQPVDGPYEEYFAPAAHLRWGSALADAPDVGPGLLIVHNPAVEWSLLTWYVSEVETAAPFVTGDGTYALLGFDAALAGWLPPGASLTGGTQYILLHAGHYAGALSAYQAAYTHTGITPPLYGAPDRAVDWAALYEVHPGQFGGFAGLRHYLPTLANLGIDTLYLMPIHAHRNKRNQPWDGNWESVGSPYAIHDFEALEPTLGSEDDLRALVDTAHDLGIRVLLDLVLQGCSLESSYVHQHPDWFSRDEAGQMVHSHGWNDTWSFDWANPDFQAYTLKWATDYVRRYNIDGFRVDAPHGKEPNWDRGLAYHASRTNLGTVSLLEDLRRRLLDLKPSAALYCELFGPLFTRSHDISNDYNPHGMVYQLFENHGRLTPAEFNAYLRDYWAIMPPDSPRICFTETHDTRHWPVYALRGSQIACTMLGILVMAGFVPMIWAGQERGQEDFLQGLLRARRESVALRRGNYLYDSVTVDDMNHYRRSGASGPADRVYTLIRLDAETILFCLASLTPERVTYRFGLPLEQLNIDPAATYQLRDLISDTVWDEYGQSTWSGRELAAFELTPNMLTPYILRLERV